MVHPDDLLSLPAAFPMVNVSVGSPWSARRNGFLMVNSGFSSVTAFEWFCNAIFEWFCSLFCTNGSHYVVDPASSSTVNANWFNLPSWCSLHTVGILSTPVVRFGHGLQSISTPCAVWFFDGFLEVDLRHLLYIFSMMYKRFFYGFQVVFDPRHLLYCIFFQWCTGGVWSTPSALWFCNGFQEVFDSRLLLCYAKVLRRCLIHALCYMFCNSLRECLIYAFCFMVLQWVTGGVWSTSPTVWLCHSLKEVFTQRLFLYCFETVHKSIWSTSSGLHMVLK